MNVFISWSGPRSKAVAEALTSWMKCVIQSVKPWISTQNLDSGTVWFNEINEQLQSTSIGIICITQENKNNPWILFETGALAKGLDNGRIYTFLVDLDEKDLSPPLSQFNHTFPTNFESMKKLVSSLNRLSPTSSLDATTLDKVFAIYWDQFQQDFRTALDNNKPGKKVEKRSGDDILEEILISVRGVAQRVAMLEMQQNHNGTDSRIINDKNNQEKPPSEARRAINAALAAARDASKRINEELINEKNNSNI